MNPKTTGEFIAQLRKEKNLTQKQLANELNVTDKAISRWETGKGFPDIVLLLDIGNFFSVSVNEILTGRRIPVDEIKETAEANVVEVVKQTDKIKKRSKKFSCVIGFIAVILSIICIFMICDGPLIVRHILGGNTTVTLEADNNIVKDYYVIVRYDECEYISTDKAKNVITYKSDYGEYKNRAVIISDDKDVDGTTFDFGFFNTNNWHNVDIKLQLIKHNGKISVEQTISYTTDGNKHIEQTNKTSKKIGDSSTMDLYAGLS